MPSFAVTTVPYMFLGVLMDSLGHESDSSQQPPPKVYRYHQKKSMISS